MTTPFSSAGFNGKPVPGFPIPLTSFKYGDFTAPEVDPYQALQDEYKTNTPPVDVSKMDPTAQMIYSFTNQNPSNAILTAKLNAIAAKDASKLARENINHALEVQQEFNEKKTQRDFKYGALARLMGQISEGFSNQSAMTVLGARSAVDAMNETMRAYPRMSFQTSAFNPKKYLS